MRVLTIAAMLITYVAATAQGPPTALAPANAAAAVRNCEPLGKAYLRTTLYFGTAHPSGTVSEGEWRTFLRDEVTPRFPQGLTVWEADGQYRRTDGRIGRERAKVLLLVHEDTATVRTALVSLVEHYKKSFQQESVLWETAPVCAAF